MIRYSVFLVDHLLVKVNSLPLSTSILKDKTHVIWWRDLTVPVSNWLLGDFKASN